jgi:rfaE bifunctional protein nucleotidyltransferase chain/domain
MSIRETSPQKKTVHRLPVKPADHLDKILTLEEAGLVSQQLRNGGKVVVQAHGAFDLLHLGHVRHLTAARKYGGVLIVTVTADRFINKGPGRPVFTETLRAEMLAALEFVDWVAINDAPDAVNAINCIQPDIYAKGKDYENPEGDVTGKIIAEREAVEAFGGRLVITDEVTFTLMFSSRISVSISAPCARTAVLPTCWR